MSSPLPVDAALPPLLDALRTRGAAVLVAPPGAGKSTRVPPAVLDSGLVSGTILLLQPRRVAARLVARRMAAERGQAVGDEVGWHIRFDRQVGPRTRIEVLTEGLLTRRLQSDPLLEGVGCVILDEFHERSLHADLTLALLAEVRREVRPELKLIVMSATLDPLPVAAFLDAEVVRAEGRVFPVEISYKARLDERHVSLKCASAVRRMLGNTQGHILAFLPGAGEIERTAEALSDLEGVDVLPLHGSLPPDAQDRALAPSTRRKVVLATNIAETSVTLEGVGAVVDTGLHRTPVFDAAVGLTRLLLAPISRASADQRAGRAGRTGPGLCLRLWTAAEQTHRPAADVPELQRADLTRTALEIRGWGADPQSFQWFAAPPTSAWRRAEVTLRLLGALDDGGLTAVGRGLVALPVEPRLARIVLAGHAAGRLVEAATAAALISEREILREVPETTGESDLELRMEALERGGLPTHSGAVREVRQVRDQLVGLARGALGPEGRARTSLLECLRAGFPERVGRRRAPRSERFKLADGTGAVLDAHSAVRDAEWILALAVDGGARGTEHRIRMAAALQPRDLPTVSALETRFDPEREAVVQLRQQRYLALVVREEQGVVDPVAIAQTLAAAVAPDPRRALTLSAEDERLVARIAWLAARRPDVGLPDVSELAGRDVPGPLITALCAGQRTLAELRTQSVGGFLRGLTPRDALAALDRLAPASLALPDGTHARLEYGAPSEPPVLAARIQQLFGLSDTPRAAGEPVLLHLLSPGNRPVQITRDLKGFWANSYFEVRKDLRGRYPRHPWPDDPLSAPATSRAKPRGT